MASCDVQLFVYDLSKGLAKQLSLPLIGKTIILELGLTLDKDFRLGLHKSQYPY